MAVYTVVEADDLGAFLKFYDVGALRSFDGIEQGVSNTNYRVVTDRGRFILTLYEPHRVLRDDIAAYIDYADALHRAHLPAPEPLRERGGARLSELAGRPATLVTFLDGEGGSAATLTLPQCRAAGEALARMHLAAKDVDAVPNRFGPTRWRGWVDSIGDRMEEIAPGLCDLVTAERHALERLWPQDLPQGAIHADYFPDNVFFNGDEVTGIIDFHFVCRDFLAYDLAIACNAFAFDADNRFVPARMDALLAGYRSIRPLTEGEGAALPILRRGAALRFLLSRIEEKLNWRPGDFMVPHDPMVFESRLRHFQAMDQS